MTVAHSRTQGLPGIVRQTEIVVAATGHAGMVKGKWIDPGTTVIDRANGLAEPEGFTL